MPTVHVTRTVAAPAPAVWAALDDFGAIHLFHPDVLTSHSTNDRATGLGAERSCEFKQGAILERIVGYEPGRSMDVEIFETGPFPLRAARATLRAEPLDGGHSEASMTFEFTPGFGPLGRLLAPLMARQFRGAVERLLAGLDRHVTAGLATPTPA